MVWDETDVMNADRVNSLNYIVTWIDQHPHQWLDGAFPASYTLGDWELTLTEQLLAATPSNTFRTEEEARSALEPHLYAWSAQLEIEQRLLVSFAFLNADVAHEDDRVTVSTAEVIAVAFNASVEVRRPAPPAPDLTWRDTQVTREVRAACLRPMRNGSRPVVDAANWLATHLKSHFDGDQSRAAAALNVSSSYLEQMRVMAARSSDRKVSSNSLSLTPQDKESLRLAVENLVKRFQLFESGLPPGDPIDRSNWP